MQRDPAGDDDVDDDNAMMMIMILQGLSETLYTKTQAASARQRREFTPKTLEVSRLYSVLCCDISQCSGSGDRDKL